MATVAVFTVEYLLRIAAVSTGLLASAMSKARELDS